MILLMLFNQLLFSKMLSLIYFCDDITFITSRHYVTSLLCLLYMNDIQYVDTKIVLNLFADDTCLFVFDKDLKLKLKLSLLQNSKTEKDYIQYDESNELGKGTRRKRAYKRWSYSESSQINILQSLLDSLFLKSNMSLESIVNKWFTANKLKLSLNKFVYNVFNLTRNNLLSG